MGFQEVYIPAEHLPARIIRVLVSPGAEVTYSTNLLLYEIANPRYLTEESEPEYIKHFLLAHFEGTLNSILVEEKDLVTTASEVVAKVEVECTHETLFAGLCVECGKDLNLSSNRIELERASIKFDHSTNHITTTKKNAEKLDLKDANRLLKARKLTLIIDLDQTIIHASLNTKIGEWMSDPENINYPATHDIGKFTLNDSPSIYYIKPRPFLKKFLDELDPLYEFHIYTMGVRSYALEVVKVIDPENKYFRERVITRDENLSSTKSISRLFPTDQSMVVAIDDRPDVWEWSPNLIRVVPFEFFPGVGDINANHLPEINKNDPTSIVPDNTDSSKTADGENSEDTNQDSEQQNGSSETKEVNGEVTDEPKESQAIKPPITNTTPNGHTPQLTEDDNELLLSLKQLKRLHEAFYKYQDNPELQRKDNLLPTVPVLLPKLKSEVLKGVYITFSGIIPIDADPTKQDAWIWAESFGAHCSTDITSKTTHLVATKQTHKVNQALRVSSIKVVHSKWLYDSVTQWERKNESHYPIPDVDMLQFNASNSNIAILIDPAETTEAENADAEPDLDEDQFHDYLEKWQNEMPSLDDPEIKELFGESFTDNDTDDDFSDGQSDHASPTNPDEDTHLHPSSANLLRPRSPSLKPPSRSKRRKRRDSSQPNQYLRKKIINKISQEESDLSDYDNGSPNSSYNIDTPYNDDLASKTPEIQFASDEETPSDASSPSNSPSYQVPFDNNPDRERETQIDSDFKDLFQEGLAVLDSDYSDAPIDEMDFQDEPSPNSNDEHANDLNSQQGIRDSGTN